MAFNLLIENKYNKSIYFGYDTLNKKECGFNTTLYGVPFLETLVIKRDIEYFLGKNLKFIYPISGLDETMYEEAPFKLDNSIIDACKQGQCKVGIMFDTEGVASGNIGKEGLLLWLEAFAKLNGVDDTNFFFAHGDRKLHQTYIDLLKARLIDNKSRVKILKYSYFENFPWFIPPSIDRVSPTKEQLLEHAEGIINSNRKVKKEKHFLCLNRLLRLPRLILFGTIASNPDLEEKTILSIGRQEKTGLIVQDIFNDNTLNIKPTDQVSNYINSYDFNNPKHILDNPDNSNKAFTINTHFHQSTFLNIVTESQEKEDTIFFSEKIFKPIYMLQPFILIGNPNSLKELQQMGYKTFSKWWDESYDEEIELVTRISKVEKILKELSKLSVDELHKITQEMEETLVHNFNRFLFDIKQETLDYLNFFILQNPPPSYPTKTFKLQVAGEKIKIQPHYKVTTQKYLI